MSDVLQDLPDDGYSDVSITEFLNSYYDNCCRSGTYINFSFLQQGSRDPKVKSLRRWCEYFEKSRAKIGTSSCF